MEKSKQHSSWVLFLLILSVIPISQADVVTDWNITARNIVVESKLYTPPANRAMALIHSAIYQATNDITREYRTNGKNQDVIEGASVEAAVAAASYQSLLKILPKQKVTIEAVYIKALKNIPEGIGKEAGIAIGRNAAEAVFSARMKDRIDQIDSYRPHTTAGAYVPTVIPAVPNWPKRQPWILDSASQFRPGPPPALNSERWVKDFNEVKEIGARKSEIRTKEQTEVAKFWEATLPPIYHGVIHSVAMQNGRTVTQNARLFAMVTQATDDALIAVFDAKHHYNFWRPITAIRNADIDDNEKTVRDASWTPFIPTPMHPEYPCAHCVVAGTVGAILKAEIGNASMPVLSTNSVTAMGAKRSWTSVEDFVQEVSDARIYDGVHYRYSTTVGNVMGKEIGELAVKEGLKHLIQ